MGFSQARRRWYFSCGFDTCVGKENQIFENKQLLGQRTQGMPSNPLWFGTLKMGDAPTCRTYGEYEGVSEKPSPSQIKINTNGVPSGSGSVQMDSSEVKWNACGCRI